MIEYLDIYDVKLANKQHGHFFFEPDTLRFFDSRIGREAYKGPGGIYFVTSERFRGSNGVFALRLYTVRKFTPQTGDVNTAGKFQQYKSASGARQAAMRLAVGV